MLTPGLSPYVLLASVTIAWLAGTPPLAAQEPCYEPMARLLWHSEWSVLSDEEAEDQGAVNLTSPPVGREWRSDKIAIKSEADVVRLWVRLPLDSVLYCRPQRVLATGFYGGLHALHPDGPIAVKGYGPRDPRAYDRNALLVDSSYAFDGYLYFFVQADRLYNFGGGVPLTRYVPFLTSPLETYSVEAFYRWNRQSFRWDNFRLLALLTAGGSLALMLYFFTFGISSRSRKIYLAYAGFLLFTGLYWVERSSYINALLDSYRDIQVWNILSQLGIHIFYIVFAMRIVNARERIPRLATLWRIAAFAIGGFGVAVLVSVYGFHTYIEVRDAFVTERLLVLAFSTATWIYLLTRDRSVYTRLIAYGSLVYGLLGLIAMAGGAIYFAVGTLIQMIVFAYAVGLRLDEDRRAKLLYEQQSFRLEREVTRTRDAALRAQMKPHFVSNVINALRSLVLDGENDRAYNYLSKFAHLVRTMLGDGDASLHPLSAELQLIRNYVELEGLRFDREIVCDIHVGPDVHPDHIELPPLLLQPLVENSVHHGLHALTQRPPRLRIQVERLSSSELRIVVEDNGVGRAAAAARKRVRSRPSMAMKIIGERLGMLYEREGLQDRARADDLVRFEDLVDDGGQPLGTRVSLHLPIADQAGVLSR